jgi:hypothetical protein
MTPMLDSHRITHVTGSGPLDEYWKEAQQDLSQNDSKFAETFQSLHTTYGFSQYFRQSVSWNFAYAPYLAIHFFSIHSFFLLHPLTIPGSSTLYRSINQTLFENDRGGKASLCNL